MLAYQWVALPIALSEGQDVSCQGTGGTGGWEAFAGWTRRSWLELGLQSPCTRQGSRPFLLTCSSFPVHRYLLHTFSELGPLPDAGRKAKNKSLPK